ncbi:hypothetical protein [Methylomonas fluvii]|uniref:Uncharacterized protein n=1 Tax=Methylomonas fluvii TaxID=1854564 RepID=A0ABR9DHY1_9GAMM|nr:hypothetical protein [Methylomonas fluvii]MBD9361839.1 hypothetical protein [Methylomonas fluvii]CAD6874852.1 hypothetical protein [Methylomonas fluvii]
MTYCLGWKYGGSVYLIADSAATGFAHPHAARSSFDELHDSVRGEFVQESLLKLVRLSDKRAATYSGDVAIATDLLSILKQRCEYGDSIQIALTSAAASVGPFTSERPVSLLIAEHGEQGPSLKLWHSVQPGDISEVAIGEIGSLQTYHSDFAKTALSLLCRGNIEERRLLPIVSAVVQTYGVHDNLIQQNIGGLIFGLQVCSEGVVWQEDTNYFLYPDTISPLTYVSAFARDDVVVVNSSVTNATSCFSNSVNTVEISEWFGKWDGYIQSHINSNNYRYWVFISSARKVITIVRLEDLTADNQYFSLTFQGNGKFDLGISPTLRDALLAPIDPQGHDAIPFRLKFLNGKPTR